MMRRTRVVAGLVLLLAGASGAAAQTPTKAVTLGFIRDQIAAVGQLNYASTTHDSSDNQTWDNQFTVEASNVTRDDAACSVSFHWHTTIDGKQAQDLESTIPFNIVTSATVTSLDDDIARLNAEGGHTSWVSQMRPPIWVLLVRKSNGHSNTIDFTDRDLAERVAKAVRHAAELCGGTSSMPF